MGVTGPGFTADLDHLRAIGVVDLPMLGYTYATVNNAVAETSGPDATAFQTSGGGPACQISDLWPALRNQLQNILGHTAENMQTVGRIVVHIEEAYAATDTDSELALNDAWDKGQSTALVQGEAIPPVPPPVQLTS